ncbi:D-alanyl-D-alanine carboxypeptidase/D-alanyl-D-alanine-endopeptidase [Rhodothermaceae bacterium RA]|nr:D-alanyl-D-alanine carboxypeptidase/D-alanyl-D-alanine-endopeptidase [Rhodothermaceae bacterium RA]
MSPAGIALCGLLILLLAGPSVVAGQPAPRSPRQLQHAVDQVLADTLFRNAFWGVLVYDLAHDRTLVARHAGKSFLPASNTKLYTTAAALDLLGPDFRYRTTLYAAGTVRDSVLHGALLLRGAGDPSLGSYYDPLTGEPVDSLDVTAVFRAWADSLRAAGIAAIEGDVIGDDDVMDDQPLGIGWSWDDEPYSYAAELGGLVFSDNVIRLRIEGRSPGAPARLTWRPLQTDYVEVVNRTRSVPADSSFDLDYDRARAQNILYVSGEAPQGRSRETALTISNPTRYAAHVLRQVLMDEGIAVLGAARDVDDLSIRPDYAAPTVVPVATYLSPPLSDLVRIVNKPSQNLYADQLLRTLGVHVPVDLPEEEAGPPGSTERGLTAAMRTFARAGVDTSRLRLADGSGLSRMNLVTPEMTLALLRYMWHHPDPATRAAFLASLPVGGVDGTLEHRFPDGPAHGSVRAKTGTLTGVSTLSGYVPSARGTPLAFVVMCTSHTVRSADARAVQDALVDLFARYRR